MGDKVLTDGDMVVFMPMFSPAIVMVQPGRIPGSGPASIGGRKVCVDGDEAQVSVPGCTYFTPSHPIPGVGTLKIASLAANQKASTTQTGGKKVLLKGGMFTAKFEVQSPAQQPTAAGPVPDASPQYSGQGQFMPVNQQVSAS
ncbi:hypothetical protein [Pseudaquabacterium pictum]|uniref:Uncharacterized protein n=1 Tax=Pseudaquabacterium pictum TaxID=2315236 RepID=A0A480ALS8_9BURK|nr:hypothetical protein [Rubrivivax pictus]GCL60932.1 hypothetical protein AQPW35_00130 [Rubrivivax pictus]